MLCEQKSEIMRLIRISQIIVKLKNMGTFKYNLEKLGWFNFEQLVRTLLRQIVGNGLSTLDNFFLRVSVLACFFLIMSL